MVTELLGPGLTQGGTAALITLVIVMVLTGRLVPRSTLNDMREERDTWREAARTSEEARHVAQEQVGELLELSRTAGHVLESLPRPHEVRGVRDGPPLDPASPPG